MYVETTFHTHIWKSRSLSWDNVVFFLTRKGIWIHIKYLLHIRAFQSGYSRCTKLCYTITYVKSMTRNVKSGYWNYTSYWVSVQMCAWSVVSIFRYNISCQTFSCESVTKFHVSTVSGLKCTNVYEISNIGILVLSFSYTKYKQHGFMRMNDCSDMCVKCSFNVQT